MLFNSINFLCFFPVVVCIYFLLPNKIRWIWILISSYCFYMCWSVKYVLLILFSTIVTYLSGILMEKINEQHQNRIQACLKKYCVIGSFFLNLSVLFFFKYYNFTVENLERFLKIVAPQVSIKTLDVLLPVGISFYTFQALSYTMDVYRGEIKAERNFLKYALYVSFFPQLVAGPIERSKELLEQINKPTFFDVDNIKNGLLMMSWGLFAKVVIADNIANVINPIFINFSVYNGTVLCTAIIFFAIQIYCDFEGYSQVAKGCAQIMGVQLSDNFNSPYLAENVKDFWKRWHISLTLWFRDYLYIPLGGNKCGKIRKYFNNLCVFLISGLWHGAGWNYIIWGGG